MSTIETVWEVWTYEVWGNAAEGFDVNDRCCVNRAFPLTLTVETYNAGTPQAFTAASPTDDQIREALDIKAGVELDTDGDDMSIYVNAGDDGFPVGELICVSHASLSPIRSR